MGLEERIPFLTSSIKDFHCHAGSPHESSLVAELASACGYSSKVDPNLLTTLRQTPTPKGESDEEYLTSCLLMVFIAVSIPKLARSESSSYQAQFIETGSGRGQRGHQEQRKCLHS